MLIFLWTLSIAVLALFAAATSMMVKQYDFSEAVRSLVVTVIGSIAGFLLVLSASPVERAEIYPPLVVLLGFLCIDSFVLYKVYKRTTSTSQDP